MKYKTMRAVTAIAVLLCVAAPRSSGAETSAPAYVLIETSSSEVRAPAVVGVTIRLLDVHSRPMSVRSLPASWVVMVTLNGAATAVELWPRATAIEADLTIRQSGLHQVGTRVQDLDSGRILAQSESVPVVAVIPLDYGVVRAGETVCRGLPGGGRGLLGKVASGQLPEGLRLWGGCLVAADSVEEREGTFRATLAVQSGSGQGRRVDRRFYDISYRTEQRLLTPRRVFYGFLLLTVLGMMSMIGMALRRRLPVFGPGTALAFSRVSGTPYRGGRATEWEVIDLSSVAKPAGAVDIGALIGVGGAGVLKVRPTSDGLVEFIGPHNEEMSAVTPESKHEVGRCRLRVPYGSLVSFRDITIAPLLGEDEF